MNPKNVSSACSNFFSQVGTSKQRASKSRACFGLTPPPATTSHVNLLCCLHTDTTPSWVNSSDVATTIQTGHKSFTLLNKVRFHFPPFLSDKNPVPSLLHLLISLFISGSFAPSTCIRVLLRLAREQGLYRRRALTKVQVPRPGD